MNAVDRRISNLPERTEPTGEAPVAGAYWMGGKWIVPFGTIGEQGAAHTYVANVVVRGLLHRGLVLADNSFSALQLVNLRYPTGTDHRVATVDGAAEYEDATGPQESAGSDAPIAEPTGDAAEHDGANSAAHPRTREAYDYLRSYDGDFDFLLDLKSRIFGELHGRPENVGSKARRRLSDRQIDAVCRCIDAAKAREQKQREPRPESGIDLSVMPAGRTHAAADNSDGELRFVVIDRVDDASSKWNGWIFVRAYHGGSGEGERLGRQKPDGTYSGEWSETLRNVAADPRRAVERFGLELGVCGVCNRELTDEESRQRGIGPVCRQKAGWGE